MPSKILKKYIWLTISCFLYLSAYAQSDWGKERDAAKAGISERRLGINVSFLADTLCKGRATGTRGGTEAAFWIERQFSEAGLIPFEHGYAMSFLTPAGAKAHNLVGLLPGSLSAPRDRYIIVGAHYDHLGQLNGSIYPGADANASGTIAMTSLAGMFAQMRQMGKVYDSSIIFVAFDAKEHDLAGSDDIGRNAYRPRQWKTDYARQDITYGEHRPGRKHHGSPLQGKERLSHNARHPFS